MIKRIELVNFMSHRRTVIEPAAGLTVLIGPNNCGKSAIVTALQILCNNDNSTYVLRHGAKECRVIVETDDGHKIQWSRKKSGGGPRYEIDGEPFDRLRGDSGVWDALKKTLRLPRVECDNNKFDVHFGEQRSPVFLLNDKGKGAAQFFASNSDAIRLVEMQDVHKTKVRDSRREQTRLLAEQTQIEATLKSFDPIDVVAKEVQLCESQFASLNQHEASIRELDRVLSSMEIVQAEACCLAATAAVLQTTSPPPKLSDPQPLMRLVQQISAQKIASVTAAAIKTTLDVLQRPPLLGEIAPLQQTIAAIEKQQAFIAKNSAVDVAFAHLEIPPAIGDELMLARTVNELRQQESHVARLTNVNAALQQRREPPAESDRAEVAALQSLIADLDQSIASHERTRQQLATAETQLASVEAEIEAWAADNPTCPTCGGDVNAEVLISGGGHRHG